jgi:hypothetical protein
MWQRVGLVGKGKYRITGKILVSTSTFVKLLLYLSLSSLLYPLIISSTEKGSVIELVADEGLYFQRTLYDISFAVTFISLYLITPRA